MKIDIESKKLVEYILNVHFGNGFIYDNEIYILTNEEDVYCINSESYYAVNLSSGILKAFSPHTEVEQIDLKVVLNKGE